MKFAGFMENDVVNGEGVCVSFWTQGCPHHCKGCHNPQTWDSTKGNELPENYVDKVIEKINRNGILRNLSILGGEPLCKENQDIVLNLVTKVRKTYPKIKIYIWSGYNFEDLICQEKVVDILNASDVLVDGKFVLEQRDVTLHLKGSKNQRVIDLQKTLDSGKIILYS